MSQLTFVIGNKNYSSWALRPWLVLQQFYISFKEVYVALYQAGAKHAILKWSYVSAILSLPAMQEWSATAETEKGVVTTFEPYRD